MDINEIKPYGDEEVKEIEKQCIQKFSGFDLFDFHLLTASEQRTLRLLKTLRVKNERYSQLMQRI